MEMSCYSIVEMAIESMDIESINGYVVDEWKNRIFKYTCEMIDDFIEDTGADGVGVELDGSNGHVTISIDCTSVSVDNYESSLRDIVKSALSIRIINNSNEGIKLNIELDGIWSQRKMG